jgi:lytic murein transglycosylase
MNRNRYNAIFLLWLIPSLSAYANSSCGGDFQNWLQALQTEARQQGISALTLRSVQTILPDQRVLKLDRSQKVFSQDWLTFSGRMVNNYRLRLGRQKLQDWRSLFQQIEQKYGVQGAVITAFWGLETDYGQVLGDFDTLRALVTLAHDCRRTTLFRPQVFALLTLIDQGRVDVATLRGAWAGEIGQIQVLPSDYLRFGQDGDHDGRIDLRRSAADAIMTAARLLQHHGWRAGEPWLQEVTIPEQLPWAELDFYHRLPIQQWQDWGVRRRDGQSFDHTTLSASLILPMGRFGPAFLAYPNFDVFLSWNQSLVYATTAAYFATRLAGANPVHAGNPEPGLTVGQLRQLQQKLLARGHDIGRVDGILGLKTRNAVREEQIRLGMPADAWPTALLLQRL